MEHNAERKCTLVWEIYLCASYGGLGRCGRIKSFERRAERRMGLEGREEDEEDGAHGDRHKNYEESHTTSVVERRVTAYT